MTLNADNPYAPPESATHRPTGPTSAQPTGCRKVFRDIIAYSMLSLAIFVLAAMLLAAAVAMLAVLVSA